MPCQHMRHPQLQFNTCNHQHLPQLVNRLFPHHLRTTQQLTAKRNGKRSRTGLCLLWSRQEGANSPRGRQPRLFNTEHYKGASLRMFYAHSQCRRLHRAGALAQNWSSVNLCKPRFCSIADGRISGTDSGSGSRRMPIVGPWRPWRVDCG